MEDNQMYIDRDESWVKFNERILTLSKQGGIEGSPVPLAERLRFLIITDSNLMEFMKVRMSKLYNKVVNNDPQLRITGKSVDEVYMRMIQEVTCQMKEIEEQKRSEYMYAYRNVPKFRFRTEHSTKMEMSIEDYPIGLIELYKKSIQPFITQVLITNDPQQRTSNMIVEKTYLIFKLSKKDVKEDRYSLVGLPSDNIIPYLMKCGDVTYSTVDVIISDVSDMYKLLGYKIENIGSFRVCNNCDIPVEDEPDIVSEMEKILSRRLHSIPIMIQYKNLWASHTWKINDPISSHSQNCKKRISKNVNDTKSFISSLCNSSIELYDVSNEWGCRFGYGDMIPLGMETIKALIKIYESYNSYENFTYPKMIKGITNQDFKNEKSIFDAIKKRDIILNHPYDSFNVVVNFIKSAARDKSVISIRQTLYRVSKDSPIVEALCTASRKGKSVTVMVELKARFDERHNIIIGKKLKKAGCNVIYGVPALKTHSKITEVIREENGKLKKYLHLGTGNYNDVTAQIYSDISLLTCNKQFGLDSSKIFDIITSHHNKEELYDPEFDSLLVSPFNTKSTIIEKIKSPETSHIMIKVNALTDRDIIDALYYAAENNQSTIDLYVRGACSLHSSRFPTNIRIYSVVGQFLEHSRVYYFLNKDGQRTMYCGSADAMPRNMERRIEILFPITDSKNIDTVYKMVTEQYPTQLVFNMNCESELCGVLDEKSILNCKKFCHDQSTKSKTTNKKKKENSKNGKKKIRNTKR